MKVIKRDGTIVDYDKEKIVIAIGKANAEVQEEERATDDEINNIIKYIEGLNKKRILVEDIQDLIEVKLMEYKRFELAKHYIVYRYTRALVRKSNTTDESILRLIRNENKELIGENSNKNTRLACVQRDYIAGEVSKDLTKRVLLRDKIVEAHEDGILYFHDMDYFIQPIFNSCLINLGDMLDNGTMINGCVIETPKSFQVACIVTAQIISSVLSNQYGGVAIETSHLGKYLKISHDKIYQRLKKELGTLISEEKLISLTNIELSNELKSGIQTLQYQISTMTSSKGKMPNITLFLCIKENDEYIDENSAIIEEILNQRIKGIRNEQGEYETPNQPELAYVLDENNVLQGGKFDYLTKIAIECSVKRLSPNFISAKKMRENNEGNVFSPMGYNSFLSPWKDNSGNYKYEGRFNQGVVSINLPQIGIEADGDEEKFWNLLDERLDLCREALMCRHYALLGTVSDVSPIHWQNGAIARLGKGEKIDDYLKNGYSTLSLGYVGLYELTKLMRDASLNSEEGKTFALTVMQHMKDKCTKWTAESGIAFVIYGSSDESVCNRFAKIDLENYGKIKDITDKGYYTNSYHIDTRDNLDTYTKLGIESEFQKISNGGLISNAEISNISDNLEELEKLIKYIYENIQYCEFNNKY